VEVGFPGKELRKIGTEGFKTSDFYNSTEPSRNNEE